MNTGNDQRYPGLFEKVKENNIHHSPIGLKIPHNLRI